MEGDLTQPNLNPNVKPLTISIHLPHNLIVHCEVLTGLLELEEPAPFLFEVKDLDDMFLHLNRGWGPLQAWQVWANRQGRE